MNVNGKSPLVPTPAIGVPVERLNAGRFARAEHFLSARGGNHLANMRSAVYEYHQVLRSQSDLTREDNSLLLQLAGLYRETNYLWERLKSPVNKQELELIEGVTGRFLVLATSPTSAGQALDRTMIENNLRFARFQAGVFALARNDLEAAQSHFSRADDNWGVQAGLLADLLAARREDEAANLLGDRLRKIRASLEILEPSRRDRGGKTTTIVPVMPGGEPTAHYSTDGQKLNGSAALRSSLNLRVLLKKDR